MTTEHTALVNQGDYLIAQVARSRRTMERLRTELALEEARCFALQQKVAAWSGDAERVGYLGTCATLGDVVVAADGTLVSP